MKNFLFTLCAFLAVLLLIDPAFAQDAGGDDWLNSPVSLVVVTVAGAVGAYGAWILRKIGVARDAETERHYREALSSATAAGINLALARYGMTAKDLATQASTIKVIGFVMRYLETAVPAAIKRFDKDSNGMIDYVEARLPAVQA